MTESELQAAELRLASAVFASLSAHPAIKRCLKDVPGLIAEIRRLKSLSALPEGMRE